MTLVVCGMGVTGSGFLVFFFFFFEFLSFFFVCVFCVRMMGCVRTMCVCFHQIRKLHVLYFMYVCNPVNVFKYNE